MCIRDRSWALHFHHFPRWPTQKTESCISVPLGLWFPMNLICFFGDFTKFNSFYMQIIRVFDRGSHFPLFWLGPPEYLHFPLSTGFQWFSRNLSPQPPWKKISCRTRHCQNLFLIKSFSESLIINPDHLEKKRLCQFRHCLNLFLINSFPGSLNSGGPGVHFGRNADVQLQNISGTKAFWYCDFLVRRVSKWLFCTRFWA